MFVPSHTATRGSRYESGTNLRSADPPTPRDVLWLSLLVTAPMLVGLELAHYWRRQATRATGV